MGPSPKVLQALQAALGEIHRYPDASAFELKAVCASYFGVPQEQIVFGNGSNELIDLLIRLYLRARCLYVDFSGGILCL